MTKNKIIFSGIFFVILIIIFVIFKKSTNTIHPFGLPPTPPIPADYIKPEATSPIAPIIQDPRTEIIYTTDGKLDTSHWQEYRSEYGGFSVRAPKIRSLVGCFWHGCSRPINGDSFVYLLAPGIDEDIGLTGFNIQILKKKTGSNLDNWINKYVISDADKISSVKKTSLEKYPALQFDTQETKEGGVGITIMSAYYPSGKEDVRSLASSFLSSFSNFRVLVVDLGDRYAIISHALSINNEPFYNFLTSFYGSAGAQVPQLLEDKTLSEIYKAILDSFQGLTPIKP